jgi:anti-anti-sigma factor
LPLTVISHIEDNFAIFELTGSLTLGPTLNTLRETARQVLNANKLSGIILHVAGVTVTDSSGLGELTVVYTLATNKKCPVRLAAVTPNLKKLLEMARLDELLPACSDIAAAKTDLKQKAATV